MEGTPATTPKRGTSKVKIAEGKTDCICGTIKNIYKPKKPRRGGKSDKKHEKTLAELCTKHTTGAEISKLQRVAFMTSQERSFYPFSRPTNKFCMRHQPPRLPPSLGPGGYNEKKLDAKPNITSTRGIYMGARTAPQITPMVTTCNPGPAKYQKDLAIYDFVPAKKPFGSGAPQAKPDNHRHEAPGPARYNTELPGHTRVRYQQSLGGKVANILPPPPVKSLFASNADKFPVSLKHRLYHRKLAYLKLYY